ncbi:MAG: peptide chain release factor aRF-1 [Halobacteriota archaeon]|nr:peptide chain release factor aRF-1 [Halobacteriota archaeon]
MNETDKYEFRRSLELLRDKSGRGTELISLYIPPDKQISDVVAQLRDEHGQASNIKSKSTRTNVQSALDSILSRLKYIRKPPENGIVLFCGAVDVGGDKTNMETTIVEPPQPINIYKYHCDSRFFLEPLEDMLSEKKTYGLLVLDKREATVGLLVGKRIEVLKHMTSSVPGKHGRGGQSQRRFERLREIAIEDFYNRIASHVNDVLVPIDHKVLKGVIIGGPSPTKEEFIKGEYLHHELRKKLLGAFDVSYTDESGLSELVDQAGEKLYEIDLMKEKRATSKFMRELVNSNLAAYGEEEVRRKLQDGAVDILLISEDLRRTRAKIGCTNCDYERDETFKDLDFENLDLSNCPKCGSGLIVEEESDIVMEFSELAERTGAEVVMVSTDFEEGSQIYRAFGGIAAVLRY